MSVLRYADGSHRYAFGPYVAYCPCGWWGEEQASEQEAARDYYVHEDEVPEAGRGHDSDVPAIGKVTA